MSRKLFLLLTIILSMLLVGNVTANQIKGTVYLSTGGGLEGVTMTATGGTQTTTALSNASGAYTANHIADPLVTVTPSKLGYTFSPVNKTYNLTSQSPSNQNYTATAIIYTISGTVGNLDGVTMTGFPGNPVSVNGSYSATVLQGWSGTVTPAKAGYIFTPESKTYTSVAGNMTGENYDPQQVTSYNISGSVGLAGVTMVGLPGNPLSGVDGTYVGSVPQGWSGTVIPTITGYTFSPLQKEYSIINADVSGEDYSYTINSYTISGTIVDGVTMNGLPGNPVSTGGAYSVSVQFGWAGTITPTLAPFVFSPATKSYASISGNTTQNFTTMDRVFTNASGVDNTLADPNNWKPAIVPATNTRISIMGDAAGAAGLLVNSTVDIGNNSGDTGNYVYVGNGGGIETALMTVDTGAVVHSGALYVGYVTNGIVNFNNGTWGSSGTGNYRNWNIGAASPNTGTGVLNMKSGTLTAGNFIVSEIGLVNMTGGTIYYNSGINVKIGGQINLTAGTISVQGTGTPTFNLTGVIDINDGKLILPGDMKAAVDANITDGKIISSSGKTVMSDYNVKTAGKTTVWAQLTDPTPAVIVAPVDQGKYYPEGSIQLKWQTGYGAQTHDVYFGTNFADVNNADNTSLLCVSPAHEGTTYDTTLELGKTYYWRIDENYDIDGDTGTLKGQVWSFETISQEQIPADPNLLGWWKFDDQGSMAWDYTGRGNHGTMHNTTFVDGKVGKALNFVKTSSSYVDIPAAAVSTLDDQVTISLWSFGSDNQPMQSAIFNATAGTGTNRVLNAHIPWVSNGNVSVIVDMGNAGSSYDRVQSIPVTQSTAGDQAITEYKGKWNHWAITKNSIAGEIKVYCNGVLMKSGSGCTKLMSGIGKFKIGSNTDGTSSNYDGMVDDFRVYNRELSAMEIMTLADSKAAYNFSPANNAETMSNTLLDWDTLAAQGATFDVYLSSNLNDQNDIDRENALIKELNISDSQFQANGLALNTTYYWAVDVHDNGNTYMSPVIMTFKTANSYASNPVPADGTQLIAATQLSWTSTIAMTNQNVYFGTDSALVSAHDASTLIYTGTAATVPVTVVSGTTYYWTVVTTTSAGDDSLGIWSFTGAEMVDPNLVGWWKMDDAQGLMAWDYSGYAHHGTFKGDANIIPDGSDYALNLDGSGDSVDIVGYRGITGAKSRTSCAWIKTSTTSSSPSTIISWGKNSAGQQWQFRLDGSGDTHPYTLRTACFQGFTNGTTPVNDGQWHHVAAVLQNDGTPNVNEIKMYLDGVEQSYTSRSDLAVNTIGSNDVKIGRWMTQDDMNGLIKDVRIYNKAFSQADIWRMLAMNPVLDDLQNVVDNWLTAGPAGDLNADGIIDLRDFNLAAQGWGWQD